MRLLSTTSYSPSTPLLRASGPVRPVSGRQEERLEQQLRARQPRSVAAGPGVLPERSRPACPTPCLKDRLDLHARTAIRAYRALDERETQLQLSQLLGVDDYA